ncbi:SbcC/MukB-like Walker B domain-containing protein [Brevundimonas sp.]|uniref:SbcC/MukB-like Walker B domain-containing protein n=1 Tax=Brevundimonas sp. TaxID=1871086 RepID=UPI003D6CF81F
MYNLSRISLVNWHLFGREDIDVRGDTAILGRNRSGKSTLIDLVQTVMTGGSSRLVRYNQSAGEGRGRSDRSLKSYCLGQLHAGVPSRRESITHIALSFEDEIAARPTVTIGLCVEASLDDARVVGFYVAVGWKADTSEFTDVQPDGALRSSPWSTVQARLKQRCESAGGRLIVTPNARQHMREYMGALFTDRRMPEPNQFIKAFIMAVSFEDLDSVERFVRDYLLEKRDINIAELRDSIQRYREIRKTIEDLQERLEALRALQAQVDRFDRLLKREEVARRVASLAGLVEAGAELFSQLKARQEARRQLALLSGEEEALRAELKAAKETLDSLQEQERQSDAAEQKKSIERDIDYKRRDRDAVVGRLKARFSAASGAVALLSNRDALKPLKLGEVTLALDEVQRGTHGLIPPDWPRDPQSMEDALGRAAEAAAARLEHVVSKRDEAIAQRSENRRAIEDAEDGLRNAEAGRVTLNRGTLKLMEVLRAEGMEPRPLCEMLSVEDEAWRLAAEALLGVNREALLVAPEHASRAVTILRSGRHSDYARCRVVNTTQLRGAQTMPTPGTLASVLSSEDPLAMAYVVKRIGGVVLAHSQDALMDGRRAVMTDGTYNDGLVVSLLEEKQFKIGRAAADLMVSELRERRDSFRALDTRLERNVRILEDIHKRLETLSAPVEAEMRLPTVVADLSELDTALEALHGRLRTVENTIDPDLRADIDRAKLRRSAAEQDLADLQKDRNKHDVAVSLADKVLGGGETLPGSWFCLKARRRRFRETVGGLSAFAEVRAAYATRRPKRPSTIEQEALKESQALAEDIKEYDGLIRTALVAYRLQFNDEAPTGAGNTILVEVKPWVDGQVEVLEGNELIRYRQQAEEAADQVGRVFRTDFVHELNSRFSQLGSVIEGLNKALKDRPFHNEIYTLKALPRPELSGLHRLARDSENDDTVLDALFGRSEPRDPEHAAALKEVENLLEGTDAAFERYQDYRNYYTFDLLLKDTSTGDTVGYDRRRGVASGAERQVPFYVIIGAALANLYHGGNRARTRSELGVGLAVFDEAFSKMDGPNQRTLLTFYDEIGLQTLIAAPTEKRSVIYENLRSVIDVFRHGDQATAKTTDIREKARSALRDANPEYLSDDVLRRRLETEPVTA